MSRIVLIEVQDWELDNQPTPFYIHTDKSREELKKICDKLEKEWQEYRMSFSCIMNYLTEHIGKEGIEVYEIKVD